MKRTAIDHPKIKRLGATLGIAHYAAVGIAECLWQFTAKHAMRGDIGKWTDAEICDDIGWPSKDADRLIKALISCRLVDEADGYRLIVHDWPEHCEDSVHTTLCRKIEHFADGSRPSMSRIGKEERTSLELEYKRLATSEKARTKTHALAQNRAPEPSLSQAAPEPSLSQAAPEPSGRVRVPPNPDVRQKQFEELRDTFPIGAEGRHTRLEDARGFFFMLPEVQLPDFFQAVNHYAESDQVSRGIIMGLARFIEKDWPDWVAPRAPPKKRPAASELIPKDWQKQARK